MNNYYIQNSPNKLPLGKIITITGLLSIMTIIIILLLSPAPPAKPAAQSNLWKCIDQNGAVNYTSSPEWVNGEISPSCSNESLPSLGHYDHNKLIGQKKEKSLWESLKEELCASLSLFCTEQAKKNKEKKKFVSAVRKPDRIKRLGGESFVISSAERQKMRKQYHSFDGTEGKSEDYQNNYKILP